jgi:hypothetical protein
MSVRGDLETKIRDRAQRDPDFRAGLLSDPNAALSEAFGLEVPPGITVRVIEETSTEVVLALPPAIDPSAPIPESELAGVAGGSSYNCPANTTMCPTYDSGC